MSDEGPLSINFDTTATKTAVPLIADGSLVEFKLNKLTREKSDKGPDTKWEFAQVRNAPDTDGGQIEVGKFGSTQFVHIQLYAKPDAKDPGWFLKKISKFTDALLGTADADNKKGKPARPPFFVMPVDPSDPQINPETLALLVGRTLVAKVKVKTGDYVGNEFADVYFPGDIQA